MNTLDMLRDLLTSYTQRAGTAGEIGLDADQRAEAIEHDMLTTAADRSTVYVDPDKMAEASELRKSAAIRQAEAYAWHLAGEQLARVVDVIEAGIATGHLAPDATWVDPLFREEAIIAEDGPASETPWETLADVVLSDAVPAVDMVAPSPDDGFAVWVGATVGQAITEAVRGRLNRA